jgi:arsenate reductase (glutaredoxin)
MIQIFGTRKSRDTQKAIRFFKERGVPHQFIDLEVKPMSRGELDSVMRSVPIEALIDWSSAEYKDLGLAYMEYDPVTVLLDHPLLFAMPVVRHKNRATAGLDEAAWRTWLEGDRTP